MNRDRPLLIVSIASLAVGIALFCVSCATSPSPPASSAAPSATSAQEPAQELFDGSTFSDTGAGTMTLRTPGGTSEGGNVPQIAAKDGTRLLQIGIDFDGCDGSVCTVYVDGAELGSVNAGNRSQETVTLDGAMLSEGVHTVEVVKMDGDKPAIYKKAQYEVVR